MQKIKRGSDIGDHPIKTVFDRTNWKLFASQKIALLKACDNDPDLEGLLHWIDAVQDAASEAGYPVVFLTRNYP